VLVRLYSVECYVERFVLDGPNSSGMHGHMNIRFLCVFDIFHSDRLSSSNSRAGGVLIAVFSRVRAFEP
jgi:hypothetical protein